MANLLTSLNSAASSLSAYEKAMEVVQNDTVNANTPGYVRQTAQMAALPFDVNGSQAGGVVVSGTLSSRDEYSEHNVQIQQSALSASTFVVSHLSAIEPYFDIQSTTGISGSLNSLFSAFSQLSISPNDNQARQSVISAAQGLARAFNAADSGLSDATTATDNDVQNTVADINALVADIQAINLERRKNAGTTTDAGLDARLYNDLETLSQYTDFTTVPSQDGTISVFLGGQTPLVVGTTQYTVQANVSGGQIQIFDSSGNDITSRVSGGQLGGLIQVGNTLLPGYRAQLNQLAQGIADTINAQLNSGVDQGTPPAAGANLFTYNPTAAAKTLSVTNITPDQIAAASSASPGGNDNAIALSSLQNATVPTLGNFTLTQFYGNLASTVGRDLSNAQNDQTTQQQLLAQAQSLRADASAVSLNEEAARLVDLQNAYEATSKLISIINEMTQVLLGILPTGY